jgi:hypothetical protein
MSRPLIHIGYHKTGTTWLQRCVFTRPETGFGALDEHSDIHDHIVFPHGLDFDAKTCRAHFQPKFDEIVASGKVPVLSAERLCGNPHSGGYDSKEIADRLADTFPDGKVLIVLREQKSIILSTYKQYIRAGGPCKIKQYLYPPERGKSRLPLFDFEHFKYHRLVAYYQTRFGTDNVLVLPFEIFRSAPRDFVAPILRFAGVQLDDAAVDALPFGEKENEGLSGFAVAMKRRLNPLVQQDRLNPGVLFPIHKAESMLKKTVGAVDYLVPRTISRAMERRLKTVVSEAVGNRYKESNARTSELIGMDLAAFGYDV